MMEYKTELGLALETLKIMTKTRSDKVTDKRKRGAVIKE